MSGDFRDWVRRAPVELTPPFVQDMLGLPFMRSITHNNTKQAAPGSMLPASQTVAVATIFAAAMSAGTAIVQLVYAFLLHMLETGLARYYPGYDRLGNVSRL